MTSLISSLTSYWNSMIIFFIVIIINIFYFELKQIKLAKEKVNTKYAYVYVNDWKRMNNEFYMKLVQLDLLGIRKSVKLLHADFKKLLEIKFNLSIGKYENSKTDNNLYLQYITNPELKEFMADPYLWIKPYFHDTEVVFDPLSNSKMFDASKHLFPYIRNLEDMVLKEVGFNLNFNYENIDKNYELFLKKLIFKKKTRKALVLFLMDLALSFILYISNAGIQDIAILSSLGFVLIYIYYKYF